MGKKVRKQGSKPSPLRDADHDVEQAQDDEPQPRDLRGLPAPSRTARRLALGLLALTALVCGLIAWSSLGEALYALTKPSPEDIGALASVDFRAPPERSYVRGHGELAARPTVQYRRLWDEGRFVLAPVMGKPGLWVEHRVPPALAGPRFVPPTRFSGRLVPASQLGAGYWGISSALHEAGASAEGPVWVLLDGNDPMGARWAFGLLALMVACVGWAVWGIVRLTRRVGAA